MIKGKEKRKRENVQEFSKQRLECRCFQNRNNDLRKDAVISKENA